MICVVCMSLSFEYLVRIFSLCVCCVFFFFKQKTAYEMRISDWSSDVCSSDLDLAEDIRSDRLGENSSAITCRHQERSIQPADKIGRASCRERVCQYV